MWFWIGLLFGVVTGLFVPTVMESVQTGVWHHVLSGSIYNVPHVPKPVTFSWVSFTAVFALVAGLLKIGK